MWKPGRNFCRRRLPELFVLGGVFLAACSDPTLRSPEIYLSSYAVNQPSEHRVSVCHGYECRLKTPVAISDDDIRWISDTMARGNETAAAERAAVARVIGWMENRVAPYAGTENDGDYRALLNPGNAGQLDCIDEAANSTSYLMLIRELGLLKFHTIGHPVAKGFLLDGRYPHVTAILLEDGNEGQYAIDSWIFSNGDEPLVIPLARWRETGSEEMYRSRYPDGV